MPARKALRRLCPRGERLGGGLLQTPEIAQRIVQPIDMVNAHSGDLSFLQEPQRQLMNRGKDRRVLGSEGGEFVDIKEAPVIDLLCRYPPVRESLRLVIQ